MAKRKLLPAQNEAELPTKSRKGEDDDSEDSSAAEAESSEEESSHHEENDGLADMMSKILNQNVGAKVRIILACLCEEILYTVNLQNIFFFRSQCSQREKQH